MQKPGSLDGARLIALFFALALSLSCAAAVDEPATPPLEPSSFGTYTNPEAAVWNGNNRYSEYVAAEDGTLLAVDVYIPTRGGAEPTEPIPVVLHYTRYIRAVELEEGTVRGSDNDPVLQHLLRHGYAVAVADARGTGASFGSRFGEFSVEETGDSYAIIEWLASQSWSSGNVGMAGRSYPGMTQYQAATQAPPGLKAIFAEMAGPSAYDFVYRGGVLKSDFIDVWGERTRAMDLGEAGMPARVDADEDGALRDEALSQHAENTWARDLLTEDSRWRDFDLDGGQGRHWSWNEVIATIDDADVIAASGIGIYHLVGWYDIYTTQQPWLYAALEGRAPQKMMIGPWVHSGGYGGAVHRAEILRWYDYWLKGIDNGVMDEPPIHYYVMRGNHTVDGDGATAAVGENGSAPTLDETTADDGGSWVATAEWPPPAERRRFWLGGGASGTIDSVNDGTLVAAPTVTTEAGADSYVVDYTSRVGAFSRWMNGYGARREEPQGSTRFDERSAEDRKALTYTTEPLTEDLTLLGYPTAHLWVTSTHTDGDFYVYLEEVDTEGRAHYVSEGVVRASLRATSAAPFENFGLPFLRAHAEDAEPLVPGDPVRIDFDLMGTAIVIDAGHRIRVTITGADAANYELYPDPGGRDAPTIEILRGGEHASYVEFPIAGGDAG